MATPCEPWRTGRPGRPPLPVPPAKMALLRDGRPLKRWRWVGCFTDELMLCAAVAHVGPLRVSWWALWDRDGRTLAENTLRRGRAVTLPDGGVRVADGPARIDLDLDLDLDGPPGVETISPHGDSYAWTRKRVARARGTAGLGERSFTLDAPAIIDDSAGYHARMTRWRWSAGVGTSEAGAAVAWNLVDGLHDSPAASENTVWVDGEPHAVDPPRFAADLSGVGDLRFTPEAARTQREDRLILASSYEQPFGTFGGSLPGAGPLRDGLGVMERHAARW